MKKNIGLIFLVIILIQIPYFVSSVSNNTEIVNGTRAYGYCKGYCYQKNILKDDRFFSGLSQNSASKFCNIRGLKKSVSSCIKIDFNSTHNVSNILIDYLMTKTICRDTCYKKECNEETTGEVFSSLNATRWEYIGNLSYTKTEKTAVLSANRSLRYVLVCRSNESHQKNNLAVDYVRIEKIKPLPIIPPAENCTNAIDDDADNSTDCLDSDCPAQNYNSECSTTPICNNSTFQWESSKKPLCSICNAGFCNNAGECKEAPCGENSICLGNSCSTETYGCLNLETTKAKKYCSIFNTLDIIKNNNGTRYLINNSEGGSLAWGLAPIMRSYAEMYYATKNKDYLKRLENHIDYVLNITDEKLNKTDWLNLSIAGWSAKRYTIDNSSMRFVVHSAIISQPILEFVEIVYSTPELESEFKARADYYLKEVEKVVQSHETEWQQGPDNISYEGEGYYISPRNSPVKLDGIGIPLNQQLSMATIFLKLSKLKNSTEYLNKAIAIGNIFKRNLQIKNETYTWGYHWGYSLTGWNSSENLSTNTPSKKSNKKAEDIGHGRIDIDFAINSYKNSQIFNESDMQIFSNTFLNNLFKGNYSNISLRVDGNSSTTDIKTAGGWLELAEFNQSVYDIIEKIYETNELFKKSDRIIQNNYAKLARWASVLNK